MHKADPESAHSHRLCVVGCLCKQNAFKRKIKIRFFRMKNEMRKQTNKNATFTSDRIVCGDESVFGEELHLAVSSSQNIRFRVALSVSGTHFLFVLIVIVGFVDDNKM